MGYVVKAMCYLDPDGNGCASQAEAFHYESKALAELAAEVCEGQVIEVRTPTSKQQKRKANQAWMREPS
ncbi:hypothetical protein [Enterococcus sp. 5B3_DIV0040]|uniref:hypothetical protein n=1 Tax=Enterococcus sp. 5B3_DIV0040 TaxID=1834182 RepID=UPI000A3310FB|nr:hypothetical protein [Enterococcus sp. 5B3_DIV0040]OTO03212.1 hypothetical protein A5883_000177 [Enterococcus sp. 5B3_DIV0040]